MSRTLTISDELYERLESEARDRGLKSVEELLRQWQSLGSDISHRQENVKQIDLLRERLYVRYGQMPDSLQELREDRAR